MGSDRLRIGSGSSWWGDRIEPAALNAEAGDLDYLCFETMAEATVSAAQVRKRRDPTFPGYDTYLDDRMRKVLPGCMRRGTRIVSNQGWINPRGAALRVAELLRELGAQGGEDRRRHRQPDRGPGGRARLATPGGRTACVGPGGLYPVGRGLSGCRACG